MSVVNTNFLWKTNSATSTTGQAYRIALTVFVLGDLNLNRLRPETPEGKLLCDLEIKQSLECMITKPIIIETHATKTTRTLIDVMLLIW